MYEEGDIEWVEEEDEEDEEELLAGWAGSFLMGGVSAGPTTELIIESVRYSS